MLPAGAGSETLKRPAYLRLKFANSHVSTHGYAQENGAGQQLDPENQRIDWLITSLAFLFPALGGALFGYDIGATSGALVSLKSAATSGTSW